mmetsp:Transcript_31231/g.38155  ORF Transcript_31231/g.38155 Transcript_31231/m.38155 type:complete len:86 (-) Transcript_31231:217-474(-)
MKNKQFIINVINDQSNNYINEMNSSIPLLPPPSNEASNENQENCPPLPNPGPPSTARNGISPLTDFTNVDTATQRFRQKLALKTC